MEHELGKYLKTLEKGEKVSFVMNGMIVDGSLNEVLDDQVVLSNATSQPGNKKQYRLTIPFENIYAWGRKEKKKDKKGKKNKEEKKKGNAKSGGGKQSELKKKENLRLDKSKQEIENN